MRTQPENQFSLHDRLSTLRRAIRIAWQGGHALSDDDVECLLRELETAIDESAELYRQLSAKRWNDRASADALGEIVWAEARRANSNVVLFPIVERPLWPQEALHDRPLHDAGEDGA